MYHFSSFIILFYNIVQENATSSAAPKERSPEMERNSGAGPENPGAILETERTPGASERRQETLVTLTEAVPTVPGTVPEKRFEGLHAAGPKTSRDISVQNKHQNGMFIIYYDIFLIAATISN